MVWLIAVALLLGQLVITRILSIWWTIADLTPLQGLVFFGAMILWFVLLLSWMFKIRRGR